MSLLQKHKKTHLHPEERVLYITHDQGNKGKKVEKQFGLYLKMEENSAWVLHSIHHSIDRAQIEWGIVQKIFNDKGVIVASWIRPYEGEKTYSVESQDHHELWKADVRSMNSPRKGFIDD